MAAIDFHRFKAPVLGLMLAAFVLAPASGLAQVWKDPTKYGTFFTWYAPSFYSGTAPRSQDPDRPHIHLARGNQLRITMPMDDAIVSNYLEDLVIRADMYKTLLDNGVISLGENMSYERFLDKLAKAKVREKFAQKASMSPQDYFNLSVATMEELEPGRVFHIRIPVAPLLKQWLAAFKAAGATTEEHKLMLVNDLLPNRLWITAMTPALLQGLQKVAAAGGEQQSLAAAEELLKTAAGKLYPVKDGRIDVYEYTTIYPAGTVQQFTAYKGKQIPYFPQTGVWPFIPRKHGKGLLGMVDYISTNPGYGHITMLPYQYGGGIYYNAIHNDGMRVPVDKSFLPKEWKNVKTERTGKQTQNLWINSRGPVSHGCTRIPSELMGELRAMIPSDGETLAKMKHYRNLSHLYDVFDVNGDGTPEAMGLKYFLAYKVAEPRDPVGIRAQNTREEFYPWLYGDDLRFEPDGSATMLNIQDAAFVGKKAVPGKTYKEIKLYEPEVPRDKLQFYKLNPVGYETGKGTEFDRELRKVGYGHRPDMKKLLLQ